MSLKDALEDRIKGLALAGADVILIKERHIYQRVMNMRFPGIAKEVKVMLVESLDDIQALSHVDMRKAGWVRKEKARWLEDLTMDDLRKALWQKGFTLDMEKSESIDEDKQP